MKNFEILKADAQPDRDRWVKEVRLHFVNEPMLLPEYASLFCKEDEYPICARMAGQKGRIIYPFIIRKIMLNQEDLYDIITPYGYGGPRTEGELSEQEFDFFWDSFGEWAKDKHVVSEFIRFMLWDNSKSRYPGNKYDCSMNVIRNLEADMDNIWMNFEQKVRKNVKRALSSGLTLKISDIDENITDFINIYYSTMDRRDANRVFYFDMSFFERLQHSLKGNYLYFYALYEGRPISAELVLFSNENMYSFLGGTYKEYFYLRPNDYLKFEIIKWGKDHGIKQFVLGGGYKPDDGIFRYKKSLAPDGLVKFQTGKRVFNQAKYQELVEIRNSQLILGGDTPINCETGYFPAYRAK